MRSLTFETKSLHSQNSLCGPLNLNSGLTQIRYVELLIQTSIFSYTQLKGIGLVKIYV